MATDKFLQVKSLVLRLIFIMQVTEMGGVQILANDWDHVKIENGERKPCPNFSDEWQVFLRAANTSGEDPLRPKRECRPSQKQTETHWRIPVVIFQRLRQMSYSSCMFCSSH